MTRSIQTIGCVVGLAFAFSALIPVQAQAQVKKGAEYVPGTVASIEKDEKDRTGKKYKMKLTKSDDGTEMDVEIGLRTLVIVTSKGDEGFLVPGAMVETTAIMSNANLFADEFTVYLGSSLPPPRIVPDKAKPKEIFNVMAKVVETRPDGVMVQVGNQQQKIGIETGKVLVNVKISDSSLIVAGDEVIVEGNIIKSKKVLNATIVTVTKKDPINSEEYLATLEDKRKPKGAAKTKAASGKSKPEAEEGDVPKTSDPFGILSGKKKTAKEKAEEKKEEAKKAAEKKEEAKKAEEKS